MISIIIKHILYSKLAIINTGLKRGSNFYIFKII